MSQLYKFWFKIEKCSKLGKLVFNIMYTLSTAISVKQIQQLPLFRITLDQRGSDDNNQLSTSNGGFSAQFRYNGTGISSHFRSFLIELY